MQIDATTRIYGIMGKPVSHSLSPSMHNAAFQKAGLNSIYLPFEVEDVGRTLDGFRALGICGVSVTVPFKQRVIPHLDSIDSVARRIDAVNTLAMDGRRIHGLNTDWIGAVRALETLMALSGKTVLILGAGGSARAIGFGLQESGATVMLANRTLERGQALARRLGCSCHRLADIGRLKADVLVNATSAGMHPQPSETPAPAEVLKNFPVVMDIVYSPLETRLLREAQQAGCRTIDGIAMLLYQGAAQFETWTGLVAPIDAMRSALEAALVQPRERQRS